MLRAYPPPYFWVLHIDGSAKPNPGRMSIGVVLAGPDGTCLRQGQALPGMGCNNEAELQSLQAGLLMAHERGARSLRIYTDSQWLVGQLATACNSGQMRPTARLSALLQPVQAMLLADFTEVQWRWVPRHHNTEADTLANQARVAAQSEEK